MKNLENFIDEYEDQKLVHESYNSDDSVLDDSYGDSGFTKLIKKFLRWFTGKTKDKRYDPYGKNYDEDALDAAIDSSYKEHGKNSVKLKAEEVDQNKFLAMLKEKKNLFKYLRQDLEEDKTRKARKYSEFSVNAIKVAIKDVSDDGLYAVYILFKKGQDKSKTFEILNIENIDKITAKNSYITNQVMSILKGLAKKYDAKKISLRMTKIDKKWSYQNLYEACKKSDDWQINEKKSTGYEIFLECPIKEESKPIKPKSK
jgi:hypothetical protein